MIFNALEGEEILSSSNNVKFDAKIQGVFIVGEKKFRSTLEYRMRSDEGLEMLDGELTLEESDEGKILISIKGKK